MNLKRNIIANYFSQIYVAIISIALLPIYLKLMGPEAYGLVGFFSLLQAWFGLLDLGLTPTISREVARYRAGALNTDNFLQLYRLLFILFLIIAIIGGGGLYLSSYYISNHWLNVNELPVVDVILAIKIMAISVALRWMSGLYRGVVIGSEKLVWLSAFNAIFATFRFIGVLLVMYSFEFSVIVFFSYQLLIAVIEFVILGIRSHFLLPKDDIAYKIPQSFEPLAPLFKFSLTIAFTSSVWILVTQTDKLVLSGILSLKDYGYFTLAVLIANGIMVISGPVSSALMPRMSFLHSQNKRSELLEIYKQSTQVVAVISGSVAITLITMSNHLLFSWTGDLELAHKAAPILSLYAAGNLFLCNAAFIYYLQYAKGNLKYHLQGNILLVIFLIPNIIFFSKSYGAIGAGWVWLVMNVIYFALWVAYVHSKLEPGLHIYWLKNDVLIILVPSFLVTYFSSLFFSIDSSRLFSFISVVSVGFISLSTSLIMSSSARLLIFKNFKRFSNV